MSMVPPTQKSELTEGDKLMVNKPMIIGVPKEIKKHEYRVGLTPSAALELIGNGNQIILQTNAGLGSGFSDESYKNLGCTIFDSAADVYSNADMIIKVKEPLPEEYHMIREGQIVFAYFHFAASRKLTEAMMKTGAICIAYETVRSKDGSLPLLIPMSEIAGRMSVQEAAKYLEKPMGGNGILIGGVPGVKSAKVLILGGGIVGLNAAKVAAGMNADVTIMDVNINRLRHLDSILPANCRTLYSSKSSITTEIQQADVIIGGVLVPGAKAPKLITREHLKLMKKGSVIIDVAVDQGGCIESSMPTTHDNSVFTVDGILHYCVANMPGAVPYSSTTALNNATIRYALQIADYGWVEACRRNEELLHGLNVVKGYITCEGVSEAFGLPYWNPLDFIEPSTTTSAVSLLNCNTNLERLGCIDASLSQCGV